MRILFQGDAEVANDVNVETVIMSVHLPMAFYMKCVMRTMWKLMKIIVLQANMSWYQPIQSRKMCKYLYLESIIGFCYFTLF